MTDCSNFIIGIIGAGAIGGAVIDRLLQDSSFQAGNIWACESDPEKRTKISQSFGVEVSENPSQAASADLIVIAVPPPVVAEVLATIHDRLAHNPVIVSFAAALPLAILEGLLPKGVPAVRVNPNSPSLIGEGYNPVVYGTSLLGDARARADRFLSLLGHSIEVPDDQMNLYTALTAVGPTYFLPVFDALVSFGLERGLSRDAAITAATATARGTAEMVARRQDSAEDLKLYTGLRPLDHVAVKGLVQAAAAEAFDRMGSVQKIVAGERE